MKAIGIGAIISAFFFFARILIRRKKAEIDCLAELGRGMELMRAELGTRLTPMPELMRLLSDRCGGAAAASFPPFTVPCPFWRRETSQGFGI